MGGTQWKFSLYFMGTVPEGITLPEDRTSKEAIDLLWNWPGVLLELTQYVWHGRCVWRHQRAHRVCAQQPWHGNCRGEPLRVWECGASPWIW